MGMESREMKRTGRGKKNRGMSLMEVLVTTLIIVTAAVMILQAYLTAAYLFELSKGKTAALNDLKNVAEAIRATPYSNMLNDFPDNTQDGPAGNLYSDIVGGYTLNSEHIVVNYTDSTADPLEILITVNWTDMRSRQVSNSISTMKTR